ncbi:MAG: methyltransferase domain-containing protein [Chitinivibrionales bacterium]|nr:methyltransferase domain-containing protein [Chitinivibrionales bacterium]MBD3358918.1 methyltransferase domain-containing protein [Chitinivibrionales bacterium]
MTREEFDRKAATWDADPAKLERARAVAKAIIEEVPLSKSMIGFEYGCGTGQLGFLLGERLAKIVMGDSSPGMLKVLEQKIESGGTTNLIPRLLDLTTDPPPSERFDIIFTLMTLHHIDDILYILRTFRSMLTTPAYLCIADLDKENGSFHGPEFTGHTGFDRKDLKIRTKQAGFADVRFRTVFEVRKTTQKGEVMSFPVFLMIARTA